MPKKATDDDVEETVDSADVLTEDLFRQIYKYRRPEEPPLLKKMKRSVQCNTSTLANVIPIVKWLPAYSIRRDLVSDIVAGLTVAVMHIPHGLAYGPLARQAPVVGLYMAVFPSIIYTFLGTSRHISLGTFAVLCMMVGEVVHKHSTADIEVVERILPNVTSVNEFSNVEVGITICFLVGALQFVMGLLHLGSLWLLLSNSLVSGFTAGAAFQVATPQIQNLLGVSGGGFRGPFKWVLTLIHLVKQVPNTNWVTFGVSCCAITLLAVFNEQIKPRIQKKFPSLKIPIPMELMVILAGIAVSYFLDLSTNYNVKIVAKIPKGLPDPMVPLFTLMPSMIIDCLVIAIVAISISLSLASIFAKKGGYKIRQNQELVAYGVANIFASFFQCVPSAASLSRSLVQSAVGGKSLIATVFTIIAIIFILLFLGPVFEPVPYCVLSSIVIVTLKGLMWQVKDFPGIFRQSKLDGAVWIVTFASVVLIDLDIGLGIGLAMSVLSIVIRGQSPSVVKLGRIPGSNIFMDSSLYPSSETIRNILMLRATGGLHFANFPYFQSEFVKHYRDFMNANLLKDESVPLIVILDLSGVPSVDPTSAAGIVEIFKDLKNENVEFYITDVNAKLYDYLVKQCQFFKDFPKSNVIFTLFDALEYLNARKNTVL